MYVTQYSRVGYSPLKTENLKCAEGCVDYFKQRWWHVRDCWKQARGHWVVAVLVFLAGLYAAYTTWAPVLRLPKLLQPESLPKLSIPWALVIILALLLFAIIEGSYRINGARPTDKLRNETLNFGRDLYRLLREAGHKQNLSKQFAQMTIEQRIDASMAANGPRVEKIHYGYLNHFRDRGAQLLRDLDEAHIAHGIEPWEINPPQAVRGDTVKKIAESCFLIAARMDIEKESKGT